MDSCGCQELANPSVSFVKYTSHLALSSDAAASSVNENWSLSTLKKEAGVAYSSLLWLWTTALTISVPRIHLDNLRPIGEFTVIVTDNQCVYWIDLGVTGHPNGEYKSPTIINPGDPPDSRG